MFGRAEPHQQWSVHAEFTISHPGANDPENQPQTQTVQGDNGVRMTYTWTSQANQNAWSAQSTPPPSGSASNRSTCSDVPKQYGFQRGNLLFTSTPPRRPCNSTEATSNITNRLGVLDSGYGSDLLSPNSLGSGVLPRRPIQPYNRKCRSTCNIILSTNVQDEKSRSEDVAESVHGTQCGRTQSLRCQTPTLRCDRKDNFYGCGDPWCHHIHYGDEFSCTGRFSPVMETCEDCPSGQTSTKTSSSNTCSTVRCCDRSRMSSLPPENETRRDACVQTFEMIDKCTSPFLKMGGLKTGFRADKNEVKIKKDRSVKKKYGANCRRRTEPIYQRSRSPSSITPDSLDNQQVTRRLTRSPKLPKIASSGSDGRKDSAKLSDSSKKPRTVHIDVYCTGTEMESDASNTSSDSTENETVSTPQTVFESEKVKITHKRAEETQLPFNIKTPATGGSKKPLVEKMEESDNDDGASTAYPSKLSSYSTIKDFSSSISSVPQSWTTYSMSSCTVPDDYDSVANTSWKDTFSDIDSLLHSRSSIAQTDSLDFVPRKLYEKNPSIDETPEIKNKDLLETPSNKSLQGSDSFEYADSEDRLRIKRMEELWRNKGLNKPWKSPHVERRHLLQQKKIKEYMEKRLSDKNLAKCESKDTDSEASDDSEKGWTIVKEENKKTQEQDKKNVHKPSKIPLTRPATTTSTDQSVRSLNLYSGNKNDSPTRSASFKQLLIQDPSLRAPFTIVPGIYTDQRAIARKFGSIVNAFRKPGHHIGPAKNPDCLCDHCQSYFKNSNYRNRARSMGDPPAYQVQNWKDILHYPKTESNSNKSVPSQL